MRRTIHTKNREFRAHSNNMKQSLLAEELIPHHKFRWGINSSILLPTALVQEYVASFHALSMQNLT